MITDEMVTEALTEFYTHKPSEHEAGMRAALGIAMKMWLKTIVDEPDERKSFETWAKVAHGEGIDWSNRDAEGDYIDDWISEAWGGWEARAVLEATKKEGFDDH